MPARKAFHGSVKQEYGLPMVTALVDPGVVAAGSNIALPDYAKGAEDLVTLILVTLSDGTAAGTVVTKTVVAKGTATPAAGEATLYDENNLRLGDATTARDLIIAVLRYRSYQRIVA